MAVQIIVYRENCDRLFAFQVFSYRHSHASHYNQSMSFVIKIIQICSNIEYIIAITLINVV